jgi:predicted ATPase
MKPGPESASRSSIGPGDLLSQRFRIDRLLGAGGMGTVYQAWDRELSLPVALKILHLDPGQDPGGLLRLKREVLLARSVTHPHVCRVHDLGRHGEGTGEVWFLTMELLSGETLSDRLRERGRLPIVQTRLLAQHMASGLAAAHRAGIVHRDFKAGNVIVVAESDGERAVITDFGLAKTRMNVDGQTRLTQSGEVLGTLAYMAPEQLDGRTVGPAADIYALGVVLFEMVTGQLPFAGKTALEIASRRLFEDAPSPRRLSPELDERWESTILRCLARAPEDRFIDVEDVTRALSETGFAAPSAAATAQVHLPAQRDTVVGRVTEVEEIARRFHEGCRLTTMQGAGGMGKTRLAVHYGRRSGAEWPGGVWFCDLTEATNLDGIASAVNVALGTQLGSGDPIESVGRGIASRGTCLVILDNFDRVVDLANATVGRWLASAPAARFLVTSRERLNLPGEQVQILEPLAHDLGLELFRQRARWHRTGFELEGDALNSADEMIQWTEGIPLAIELAAARMRLMTPQQLVSRARERFRLLSGGERGRHAALRTAFDATWELLRPWERAALAQCSVFEGGFTLDAAEEVFDLATWPESPWVVDIVQSLVDKSLVRFAHRFLTRAGASRGALRNVRESIGVRRRKAEGSRGYPQRGER